jgi:hypothetical protein
MVYRGVVRQSRVRASAVVNLTTTERPYAPHAVPDIVPALVFLHVEGRFGALSGVRL